MSQGQIFIGNLFDDFQTADDRIVLNTELNDLAILRNGNRNRSLVQNIAAQCGGLLDQVLTERNSRETEFPVDISIAFLNETDRSA